MNIYTLKSPDFIKPQWFDMAKGVSISKVAQDGTINVFGEKLSILYDSEKTPITPGTPVRVWLESFFQCCTVEDYEKSIEDLKKNRAAKELAEKERLDKIKKEAEDFNRTLLPGVSWVPGQKEVLSGLSETSMGNGRRKNTVDHIYLLEDFQQGRIKRKKGDFLCSSSSKMNGQRWSGVVDSSLVDGSMPKITCKKCIEIANRMISCNTK